MVIFFDGDFLMVMNGMDAMVVAFLPHFTRCRQRLWHCASACLTRTPLDQSLVWLNQSSL